MRISDWSSDVGSSDLSTERRRAWRAAASGEARVMVGARSALFRPYPDLRLIVVDEAHETSFKQEEGVMYHARDVAVMRAQLKNVPVIIANATPAIETRVQVESGLYYTLELPSRYGGAEIGRQSCGEREGKDGLHSVIARHHKKKT